LLCTATTTANKLRTNNSRPEILCLKNPEVRDTGTGEQFLEFIGTNLIPSGTPPSADLTIPILRREQHSIASGSNDKLYTQLTGGLNGSPGDTSPRQSLASQFTFKWDQFSSTAPQVARWDFQLRPFLVAKVAVSMVPLAEQWVYEYHQWNSWASASGLYSSIRITWRDSADPGLQRTACQSENLTTYGDVGSGAWPIDADSCGFEIWAVARWGGSSGITARQRLWERYKAWLGAGRFESSAIVNQGTPSAIFSYPPELLGGNWTGTQPNYNWYWKVEIGLNDGRTATLFPWTPSAGIANASADQSGKLTVNFTP
jgi:hypothetical protein